MQPAPHALISCRRQKQCAREFLIVRWTLHMLAAHGGTLTLSTPSPHRNHARRSAAPAQTKRRQLQSPKHLLWPRPLCHYILLYLATAALAKAPLMCGTSHQGTCHQSSAA